MIAESLAEFGRCLRETELPNDVESTKRILESQTAEHDAIKVRGDFCCCVGDTKRCLQEDFRISIRKGLLLLRQVRQLEAKPCEQLSPTVSSS